VQGREQDEGRRRKESESLEWCLTVVAVLEKLESDGHES
jgi:hypothetical protein